MRAKLWIHLCEHTRELTWVGRGEQCNWCDVREFNCAEGPEDEERLLAVPHVPQERGPGDRDESPKR